MTARYEKIENNEVAAPWLVMVHGMSQDRRIFSAQVEAFRRHYPILLVDLPGHGLSADLPGPFGHLEMAEQVAAALQDARAGGCYYWATHTGTALGLLLAARRPETFRALVLEGTVLPGHAMASVDAALQQARDRARSAGLAAARDHWFDAAPWFEVVRRHPETCRAEEHRAIVLSFSGTPWLDDTPARAVEPIDERIARLRTPILFYNGEHDLPDFRAAADRLGTLLPTAQRATIPRAGAFPAWEFPGAVNELVARFLDQV